VRQLHLDTLNIRELAAKLFGEDALSASVDRAKPAICRHVKTGHFR